MGMPPIYRPPVRPRGPSWILLILITVGIGLLVGGTVTFLNISCHPVVYSWSRPACPWVDNAFAENAWILLPLVGLAVAGVWGWLIVAWNRRPRR